MIAYINRSHNKSTVNFQQGKNEHAFTRHPGSKLSSECITIPHGFVVTPFAFEEFLTHNGLHSQLHSIMHSLNGAEHPDLADLSARAGNLLLQAEWPPHLQSAIVRAYRQLGVTEPVIVSSHNIEKIEETIDPAICRTGKSISGEREILEAIKNCYAALYTTAAVQYRQEHHVVHDKAGVSVRIEKIMCIAGPLRFDNNQAS